MCHQLLVTAGSERGCQLCVICRSTGPILTPNYTTPPPLNLSPKQPPNDPNIAHHFPVYAHACPISAPLWELQVNKIIGGGILCFLRVSMQLFY